MNARVRLVLLSGLSLALLIVVTFSLAHYWGDTTKSSAIVGLVVAIFAIAMLIGVTVLEVRLVRSYTRSRELRRRLPEAQVIVSLLWGATAWTRAGVTPPRHPIRRLGTMLFSTLGMTADSNGLSLWTGVRIPTAVREVAWWSVEAIRESPVLLNGRRYPFLELNLQGEERLLVQVESLKLFLPIAKLPELKELADALDSVRRSSSRDGG